MQRKALEVSISKNKRFEEVNLALTNKNRELSTSNASMAAQIEQLESDLRVTKSRFKKEREALDDELDDKKAQVTRYSNDIKEIAAQKLNLKAQVDEYEAKIKSLIGEIEQLSKKHIGEVNELHNYYLRFKSEAAELKTRLHIYKQDQEKAIQGEREAKKEVVRLTFANDELVEKNRYFDRRFNSLVQRCAVSQEDLDAIEAMVGNSNEMGSRRVKGDRSNSREGRAQANGNRSKVGN